MTNAEAIEYIKKNCYDVWCEDYWLEDDWLEAMDTAIKALEAQDSKTRRICDTCKHSSTSNKKWPCVDCDMREPADRWEPKEAKKLDAISRQAAIYILDAYQVMVENGEENPYAWARLRMSELPSAQPEIIHCRDCRYCDRGIDEDGNPFLKCLGWVYGGTQEEDFCSHAERRTDEDD